MIFYILPLNTLQKSEHTIEFFLYYTGVKLKICRGSRNGTKDPGKNTVLREKKGRERENVVVASRHYCLCVRLKRTIRFLP